ncbi:hypothetical protein CC1G_15288 [Coprinopsis cinerea okayama7|uniref:Uncharacterized protein n=1 Tax=Coprinopsis cinerea (strain Okayama-7 / 130 / ATCC MYA-4618 / FGSC 9003) TaxID=240176 RepID=D6RQ81_COPC7|nr:hypothetical protein CC1G_15288 [Coprinopsis cinerea okayama7\|eukprot:XP_002910381.1 hypothetical protein CC1G_15288 [Coprinopsis cinerea okayama7\
MNKQFQKGGESSILKHFLNDVVPTATTGLGPDHNLSASLALVYSGLLPQVHSWLCAYIHWHKTPLMHWCTCCLATTMYDVVFVFILLLRVRMAYIRFCASQRFVELILGRLLASVDDLETI